MVGTPGSKSWELVREASGDMVFDYIIFNFPHTGCGVSKFESLGLAIGL